MIRDRGCDVGGVAAGEGEGGCEREEGDEAHQGKWKRVVDLRVLRKSY